jgi:hypothetical protein
VNGLAGYRYVVCPSVALGLLLLAGATGRRGASATLAATLLGAGLATGVAESLLLQGPMTGLGQAGWRDEVARWRRDPDHRLRAWPSSVWFTNLAEPGRASALRTTLANAPAAMRLDNRARLDLDDSGLPAYFALRFEACGTAPASLRVTGLDAEGGELFGDERLLPQGCTTQEINSMSLAFAGFDRYSRVVALGFATPAGGVVELRGFHATTPVLGIEHPMSGD